MKQQHFLLAPGNVKNYWNDLKPKIKRACIKFSFLFLLFILISNQEISFHIHIGQSASATPLSHQVESVAASLVESPKQWWEQIKEEKSCLVQQMNLSNAATAVGVVLTVAEQEQAAKYSNLGFFLNPKYASKKGIDQRIVAYKAMKCHDYIQRYRKTASEEANLYGIPVAITLAQGLLESNAGDSKLARKDNNHFGIKCKAKCVGCRCANYTDDSKYDMFRVFDSAWYSFREHSNLLNSKRYRHLSKLDRKDYKNWARGLKAAGYATDKRYADKLIQIIETFQLHRFD